MDLFDACMGNILCKERYQPRRRYVKSPIDQVLRKPNTQQGQYAFNVYPNSIDYSNPIAKPGVNQMYYNSVPNLNTSNDISMRTASIILPDPKIFDDGIHRPVPPIRRKKLAKKSGTLPAKLKESSEEMNGNVKSAGFKDIFGENRSTSYQAIDTVDGKKHSAQGRAVSCIEIDSKSCASPTKKLSIGNKKTDKFFGENLSDSLSDEIVDDSSPAKTNEVQPKRVSSTPIIVAAKEKVRIPEPESPNESRISQTFSTSLDKKAEFLMRMLESDEDESDKYKNKQPVEEDPFTATKKITKHICDDDVQIRSCLHKDEELETIIVEEKPIELQKINQVSNAVREASPKSDKSSSISVEMSPEKSNEGTIMKSHQIEVTAEISPSPSPESYRSHDPLHTRSSLELIQLNRQAERAATSSPPILPFEQPPKKPDRDFSQYKRTSSDEIELERPLRAKKISRENLPSPPATPDKKTAPKLQSSSGSEKSLDLKPSPEMKSMKSRKTTPYISSPTSPPPASQRVGLFAQLISPDHPKRGFLKQMSEPINEKDDDNDQLYFKNDVPGKIKPVEPEMIQKSKPMVSATPPPTIKVNTAPTNMRFRKISAPQGPKEIAEAMKNPRLFQKSYGGNNNMWNTKTNDLMDSIIKKAYGLHEFSPEDHGHGVSDISIGPTSKLQTRKISVPRKSPTSDSRSISPRPSSTTPGVSIEDLTKTEIVPPPRVKKTSQEDSLNLIKTNKKEKELDLEKLIKKVQKKEEVVDVKKEEKAAEKSRLENIKEEKLKEKMEQRKERAALKPIPIPSSSPTEALQSPNLAKTADNKMNASKFMNPLNDIIDEIYSKNSEIMLEFQSYIEKMLNEDPKIDASEIKAFLEIKETGITSSTPEPGFAKQHLHIVKNPDSDVESETQSTQRYSDSFESSDDEDEKKGKDLKIVNKNLILDNSAARRGSIEDVDRWFTNYSGTDEAEIHGKIFEGPGTPTYDTKKIYPFGKPIEIERRDSASDDFFNRFSTKVNESLQPLAAKRQSQEKLIEVVKPVEVDTEEVVMNGDDKSITTILKFDIVADGDRIVVDKKTEEISEKPVEVIEVPEQTKCAIENGMPPVEIETFDGSIKIPNEQEKTDQPEESEQFESIKKDDEKPPREHRKSNVLISWPLERPMVLEVSSLVGVPTKAEENVITDNKEETNKSLTTTSETDHSSSADHSLLLKYLDTKTAISNDQTN